MEGLCCHQSVMEGLMMEVSCKRPRMSLSICWQPRTSHPWMDLLVAGTGSQIRRFSLSPEMQPCRERGPSQPQSLPQDAKGKSFRPSIGLTQRLASEPRTHFQDENHHIPRRTVVRNERTCKNSWVTGPELVHDE